MNFTKPFFLVILLIFIHFSVEAKRTQEYRFIEFQISVDSNLTYSIAVLDKREVVTDGSQGPDFVGYVRSTVAIAWPLKTESGNSFTDDITLTIKNAIEKSGAKVTQVSTDYSMDSLEVLEKLKATNADILLLITINKWRSDTKSYFNKIATDMIWDITLQVYDEEGEKKAENNVSGKDGALDPSKKTNKETRQKIIDVYYKEKMEELFSEENIDTNLIE